jgi:hypothetical protein
MKHENLLDTLLKRYFSHSLDDSRLNRLESDVWRKIEMTKAEQPAGAFERLLAAIFQPQYQLAPVAIAIAIGLFAGHMVSFNPPPQQQTSAAALNFEVFSSQSDYLISTKQKYNSL